MRVWWSKRPEPGNLGDVLTPYILDHFGIQYKYTSRVKSANALCIGSVAKFAQRGMIVLGAGTMRESDVLNKDADWRFVRGPKTREIILRDGGDCPEIYGDPALLMPLIVPPQAQTEGLGYVPHYVDYEYVKSRYLGRNIIDVLNPDPLETVRQISQCERIISSSLHGIIIAHAYGIPAAWVEFSDKLSGDGIKFADHFETMGLECRKYTESNVAYRTPKRIDIQKIVDKFLELR